MQEGEMRAARIVIIVAGIACAVAVQVPANAQESFYNKRFCTVGGSDNSGGAADCAYSTWEQCRAAASGLARYCAENPNWKPAAQAKERPRRTRRN
jgi:hypothetical protein